MIMKLLLIIGVISFVYFFFIKKKPALTKDEPSQKKNKKDEVLQGNDMIECKSCGVFFEVDDGILSGNEYYCSSECVTKAKQ